MAVKLTAFEIQNYRSIDRASASDLGSLVVLIGKNSSGKSNILEGLTSVFQYFDVAGGNVSGIDDYVYYKRRSSRPARFALTLELSESEVAEIFPADWIAFYGQLLGNPAVSVQRQMRTVTIERELSGLAQGTWKTVRVEWGSLPLVFDGAQVSPESVEKSARTLVLSTQGDRINLRQVTELNDMKRAGPEVGEVPLPAAPPTVADPNRGELPSTPKFTQPSITAALGGLTKLVKGRFKLVSIARDVKTPGILRDTVVDTTVQNHLWTLDQSTKYDDGVLFNRVERAFEHITGDRLDLVQGKAYLKKASDRIPLSLEGGGIQSSLNLTATLFGSDDKAGIYALEEPEGHAHPELQRRLLEAIRDLSESAQVFIVTHSSIFVDRSQSASLLIVKHTNAGTRIERATDYTSTLREIGSRLSDLFLADRVLIVEGESEVYALPAIARGAGIDLSNLQILQAGGKRGAGSRLETLLSFARDMVVPFVMLDKDAQAEQLRIVSKGLVPAPNVRVLARGTIEDYYPPDLVESAAKRIDERFGLGIRESEGWKKWREGRLPLASIDVGKKSLELGGGWKTVLARSVAEDLEKDSSQVPEELIEFLRSIAGPMGPR